MWPESSSLSTVNLEKKISTVPEISNFSYGLLFWGALYISLPAKAALLEEMCIIRRCLTTDLAMLSYNIVYKFTIKNH